MSTDIRRRLWPSDGMAVMLAVRTANPEKYGPGPCGIRPTHPLLLVTGNLRAGFTDRTGHLYSNWSLKRPKHHGLKTVCRATLLAPAAANCTTVSS